MQRDISWHVCCQRAAPWRQNPYAPPPSTPQNAAGSIVSGLPVGGDDVSPDPALEAADAVGAPLLVTGNDDFLNAAFAAFPTAFAPGGATADLAAPWWLAPPPPLPLPLLPMVGPVGIALAPLLYIGPLGGAFPPVPPLVTGAGPPQALLPTPGDGTPPLLVDLSTTHAPNATVVTGAVAGAGSP